MLWKKRRAKPTKAPTGPQTTGRGATPANVGIVHKPRRWRQNSLSPLRGLLHVYVYAGVSPLPVICQPFGLLWWYDCG